MDVTNMRRVAELEDKAAVINYLMIDTIKQEDLKKWIKWRQED